MSEGGEPSSDRYCSKETVRTAKTALGNRSNGDKEFLYKRVGKLIEYTTGRIDYFENARSRIFTVSMSLLGFGVTLLIFGIDYLADVPWLLLSVLILIGAAMGSMSTHLYQSLRSYSFQKAVQSPWYYVGNIPAFNYPKGYPSKKEKEAFCEDVAHNYKQMTKEDLASALEKDIGQLVRLYTIMAYKRKDAKLTTKWIEWGLFFFILSMTIPFVVYFAMLLP